MSGHHDYENGYKSGYADGLAVNTNLALLKALERIALSNHDNMQLARSQARAAIDKIKNGWTGT